MKCNICGRREAVIHIQQIIGNKQSKLHLCEKCAAEKGITSIDDKLEMDIAGLFAGLFESRKAITQNMEKKSCRYCGTTFDTFNKKNRFGCNHCYAVFSRILRYKFKKLTSRRQYQGKIPKKLQSYKILFIDLEKLKKNLEEAVRNEDYEKAANIRDEIKRLKYAGNTHEHTE